MRLSIGVPAYNHARFLRGAVESLLAQVAPFDEIVVSDNWSNDGTDAILAELAAEHAGRVRVVRPGRHLAAAEHWNFVVGELAGEWVSLLSSDDVALPNFSASVRHAVNGSAEAVLVRGGWRELAEDGRVLGERRLLSVRSVTRPAQALYEQRMGPKGSFASFAMRRDVWKAVGGFPEELTVIADWGMWLLAGALGTTVATGDLLAGYRIGHQDARARARLPVHIRESFLMYRDVMPRATELAGLGRPGWIEDASRARLRQMLRRTSSENGADERADLVEAFTPWARAVGEEKLLARLARGEAMREWSVRGWARKAAARMRLGRWGAM